MFFDMQKYVYSDSVFNITYIVIKQILKKFSFDKIIGKKNPSFFFHCSVAARVFKIQWYLREPELLENWPGDKFFKLRKSKLWEC